jgi:hypothetical protein
MIKLSICRARARINVPSSSTCRLCRSDLHERVPPSIRALFDLDPMKIEDTEYIGNVCRRLGSRLCGGDLRYDGWEPNYDQANTRVTCLFVFWNCNKPNMLEHSFCKLIPFARERLHGGASGDFELYFERAGTFRDPQSLQIITKFMSSINNHEREFEVDIIKDDLVPQNGMRMMSYQMQLRLNQVLNHTK